MFEDVATVCQLVETVGYTCVDTSKLWLIKHIRKEYLAVSEAGRSG